MLIRLSFAFLGREWGKPTQSPSAGLLQALMRGLRKPCRMVLRSSDAKWLPGGSQQNELLWHKDRRLWIAARAVPHRGPILVCVWRRGPASRVDALHYLRD